jgi:hypothetical protein
LTAKDEAAAKRRAEEKSEAKREEEEQLALEKECCQPLDRVLRPEEEGRLNPGDEFQECKDCPRMMVVPSGTFTMSP